MTPHRFDDLGSRLRMAWASQAFKAARGDYYEYLADVMQGTSGRKTLRDILLDDAARYGDTHPRGRLSAMWAERFQESGGDLHETFRGTLPRDDVMLIRMAQRGGAGALEQTLRDVASVTRLIEQARNTLVGTIAVGLVAAAVAMGTMIAIPAFTVPRLRQAFGMVPDEFIGATTRRLYAFAGVIQEHGLAMALAVIVLACAAAWSLPNFTGPVRRRLDEWGPWRLYRDLHGIRFLASLATMVKKRGNVTTALRDALDAQLEGAGPWQRWHVEGMLARIDDGKVGSETFDTGIVDRETLWFLTDLIAAQGMDAALARTRLRIESRSIKHVARKAMVIRWAMLLGAVGALMGIVFWHLAVVNEMRTAMTSYYSSL